MSQHVAKLSSFVIRVDAGYIGKGMLSSAVLGNVFSSPSVVQILNSIRYSSQDIHN